MIYKEFKDYCNCRVRDGKWNMSEAMTCISILDKIENIKVKGFFKKGQQNKQEN